jgi:GNAT superfamily N-acetyltransferase
MTAIALRPATPADSEFCFQLHKAAMGGYITATWGWDEQVQRGFHAREFAPGRWQIITADGADVGVLEVEHRPGQTFLSRLEVHPGHQGRGIGTGFISALIDQAGQHGQDLVLEVLAVNLRAQALYQRLGMKETARHGPGNIKITMRRRPRPGRARRALPPVPAACRAPARDAGHAMMSASLTVLPGGGLISS